MTTINTKNQFINKIVNKDIIKIIIIGIKV